MEAVLREAIQHLPLIGERAVQEELLAQLLPHSEPLVKLLFQDRPLLQVLLRHLRANSSPMGMALLINLAADAQLATEIWSSWADTFIGIVFAEQREELLDFGIRLLPNLAKVEGATERLSRYLPDILALFQARDESRLYLLYAINDLCVCPSAARFFSETAMPLPEEPVPIVTSIIRNCMFSGCFRQAASPAVLEYLFANVSCASFVFDADERHYSGRARRDPVPARPYLEHTIDALVLFGSERAARDRLREYAIYPVLRELHRVCAPELRGPIESLVGLLIRDEEQCLHDEEHQQVRGEETPRLREEQVD